MSQADVDALLADLRDGRLRDIGPKVNRLTPARARAVARHARRQLEQVVADGSLSHDHRWLVTTLQFLAPPEAGEVVTQALKQAITLEDCCGCTLNRLIRTLGAIRPPEAVPALVDVVCQADQPRHQHLAAVCTGKIVQARDGDAMALLHDQAPRLRRQLSRLTKQVARTRAVTPEKPWDQPPGSPGWFAAAARAVKAITRLLAVASAHTG